jgi:hypothetical protein
MILAATLLFAHSSFAQSNIPIYTDSPMNGWLNGSTAVVNLANIAPAHSGSDSISVTITQAGGFTAFKMYHAPMNTTGYAGLTFWLNGGPTGGQQLQVYARVGSNYALPAGNPTYALTAPPINTWQQYFVPLSAIGVANVTNFSLFAIQDALGYPEPTFYVDDIQLVTSPPAGNHLTVNASQINRTADARWFGMNTVTWGNALRTPTTITDLSDLGSSALRFPGGSESDQYNWLSNSNVVLGTTRTDSTADFIRVVTTLNAQAMITLNYGSGSPNEAAAWVAYLNAQTASTTPLGTDVAGINWGTAGYWASLRAASPLAIDDGRNFLRISHPAPLGFKYFEIGNEIYLKGETDNNSPAHDSYTYALRASDYTTLIKSVDPTVHIGVDVAPGDNSIPSTTGHYAFNPRTGTTNYGWTPIVLSTLKSLGVTPDFLIYHNYPQTPNNENDPNLLQSSVLSLPGNRSWSATAAVLRWEISDYFGLGGTNIELVCTENNSVSSNPGKQTTSLVNGLYLADCHGAMMQTEFKGLFWHDLSNGDVKTGGNISSYLYGWRLYGDYGVFEGTTNFPTYYMLKLLKTFSQSGDSVVSTASDSLSLSTYATLRQNGNLAILVINKNPANTITAQLNLAGFSPASAFTVYSYGIPQDQAAEFGTGSQDIAQTTLSGAAPSFNYSFPPYSATVLLLSPPSSTGSVNSPPYFTSAPVPTTTIQAGSTLTLDFTASDADLPNESLTFSIASGPFNANINSLTGVFTWTPTVAQQNSSYSFTVVVTDNGSPSLSATRSFTVIVKPAPNLVFTGSGLVGYTAVYPTLTNWTDGSWTGNALFKVAAGNNTFNYYNLAVTGVLNPGGSPIKLGLGGAPAAPPCVLSYPLPSSPELDVSYNTPTSITCRFQQIPGVGICDFWMGATAP